MPSRSLPEQLGAPVPVHVLTGFLGSGKTTILRHLLAAPELAKAAVVINEFGETGLDHLLVGKVDDTTVLLENGCLCCSLRDDLAHTLRQLFVRRASGELPAFDRIVIETTGLAEPGSVARCLLQDQLLADCCRLGGMAATLDAVNGSASLAAYTEARRQLAAADRILLTKTDIAMPEAAAQAMRDARALNPSAPISVVTHGAVEVGALFSGALYDRERGVADLRSWLAADCVEGTCGHAQHAASHGQPSATDAHALHETIHAFCLTFETPHEWRELGAAFQRLFATHGVRLLRVKGILAVAGRERPVVVHAMQGLVHPPVELDAWPDADRRSRLVFIADGVDRDAIEAVFLEIPASRPRGLDANQG